METNEDATCCSAIFKKNILSLYRYNHEHHQAENMLHKPFLFTTQKSVNKTFINVFTKLSIFQFSSKKRMFFKLANPNGRLFLSREQLGSFVGEKQYVSLNINTIVVTKIYIQSFDFYSQKVFYEFSIDLFSFCPF